MGADKFMMEHCVLSLVTVVLVRIVGKHLLQQLL